MCAVSNREPFTLREHVSLAVDFASTLLEHIWHTVRKFNWNIVALNFRESLAIQAALSEFIEHSFDKRNRFAQSYALSYPKRKPHWNIDCVVELDGVAPSSGCLLPDF